MPLLLVVPPFVLAQVLSLSTGPLWLLAAAALLSAFFFKSSLIRYPSIAMLLGILSSTSILKPAPEIDSKGTYLVKVVGELRHKRVGQVTLPLMLLGRLNTTTGKMDINFSAVGLKMLCKAVDLPWKNISKSSENSLFLIQASFKTFKARENIFSYAGYLKRHRYQGSCRIRYATAPIVTTPSLIQKARNHLIRSTRDTAGDSEATALLLSMALGQRDLISRQTEEAFKHSGLMHILIVSGYQITIVYATLFSLLIYLLSKATLLIKYVNIKNFSQILAALLTLNYVLLTGIDGSSLRALLSLLVITIALSLEYRTSLGNTILAAALGMSIVWPGTFLDLGTQLTFAALCGIWCGSAGQKMADSSTLKTYISICLHATLFTSIIVALRLSYISLTGFLLNILLAPIAVLIGCKLGLLAMALNSTGLDPYGLLTKSATTMLEFFRNVILWSDGLWTSGIALSTATKSITLVLLVALAFQSVRRKLLLSWQRI